MNKKVFIFPLFVLLILLFPQISHAEDFNLFDVKYDSATKTINLKTSKEVKPEITKIDDPPRTVIDLPSTIFEQVSKKIDVNDGFIKQIRVSQFKVNPSVVRITIDVLKHIDFDLKNTPDKSDERRQIIKLTALEYVNSKININDNSISKYNKKRLLKKSLEKNSVEAVEYSKNRVTLSGKSKISYEINKDLKHENRYSITLFDFNMNGLDEIPVKLNQNIESIKVEQKSDNAIIWFKLKSKMRLTAKPSDANKLDLFATNETIFSPTDTTPVINERNNNYIAVDFNETEKRSSVYISSNGKSLKYKLFQLANPDRLVIDTYGTSVKGFEDPFSNKYSRIVQRVRYGYIDKSDNLAEGIRVVFELKKKISIHENLKTTKSLQVDFIEDLNQVPTQKYAKVPKAFNRSKKFLIVLDPGHGGNDPGAIGPKGVREKDVTLGVTYYVRKMLLENGMAVLMARADDSEIDLQPRVDVANNNNADLFVSVHCNAMDGNSPRGVETYYRTPQSDGFSKVMHKNMIDTLGTPDRGIRVRNFFVIRKTVMPSVLIEIGYVTNPIEEQQLNSPSYQKQVATAIYKGIKEYIGSQAKI